MPAPISKHRLRSSAFERQEEKQLIPKRVIYLSVEGDTTERNYFECLNECMDNTLFRIEVLRHKQGDGYSDPEAVIELLEEYIYVRNGELIPDEYLNQLLGKYTKQELQWYLDNQESLPAIKLKSIREDLLLAGIDLDYRKYLNQIDPHEDDVFAIVIDRDCGNHSRELMIRCWEKCLENGYGCFITNPCFEFWLLLHLRDVKSSYTTEELSEFLKNEKISARHTKTSAEVSRLAKHHKRISVAKFQTYYYPHIRNAIKHAKQFPENYPDILDGLGTNLPQLLKQIGLCE